MTANKGFVVPAGGGKHYPMDAPGRNAAIKLMSDATGQSVMMFEETLPPGTMSLHHLHRDSDEVAWVLEGELAFKIGDQVSKGGPGTCAFFPRNVAHAWKNIGATPARALFMYTPAAAGRYVEELLKRRNTGSLSEEERQKLLAEHHWEVLGANPL